MTLRNTPRHYSNKKKRIRSVLNPEIHYTRAYKRLSNFFEREQIFQNLESGRTLATEFSQTSRLQDLKLHINILWETDPQYNPTAVSRDICDFMGHGSQK